MGKIRSIYKKNEKFVYSSLISLVCTGIRFAIYFLFLNSTNGNYLLANLISYVISFTILFFANQKLFESKPERKKDEAKQLSLFVIYGIIGFFIDSALLTLFIETFKFESVSARVFSALITFIYNYFTNKLFVFKYRNPFVATGDAMYESSWFYKTIRFLFKWLFKLWYNPKIIGKENKPKNGNIVVAGNHKSMLDPCLVVISTNRVVHFLAKDKYYDKKIVGDFFKLMQCIKVNTKKKDGKALENAIAVLKEKGVIGIFPEGTRNKTKELLQPFKFGAVKMAEVTDSYIVPFAITGDYKFRSKNLKIEFDKPYKIKTNDLEKENKKLYKNIESILKKEGK